MLVNYGTGIFILRLSVCLSLALKPDGLGIQYYRGFPYQCFLGWTGAL